MTPKLILVPDDFTEPSTQALRYAGKLAEHWGAHLLVIHADPLADPDEAHARLATHAACNVHPFVHIDTQVVNDWPVEAIVQKACDTGADFIVIGTHGRTGAGRLFLGSVTEAVIRMATVPVISVNPSAEPRTPFRKVLCPVSFTPSGREALRYAADLAPASPLVLLRGCDSTGLKNRIDELIALQSWAPEELAPRCEIEVLPHRTTTEQLVDFSLSQHIDLIALAVPGDLRVVAASKCPVLTINEQTALRLAVRHVEVPNVYRSAWANH